MLDQPRLDRLLALWQQRGAPIAASLAPGLDPDDARVRVRAHPPLELSDELVLWFSWHDGAPVRAGSPESHWIGGPLQSRPLSSSLDDFEELGDELDDYDRHLLPIFSGKDVLFARCAPDSPGVSEIWIERWSEEARPILPSFGHLIDVIIELIEIGAWVFDPNAPDGGIVDDLVPPHIRELGFT